MQEDVARYIIGCILCCTNRPCNRKQVIYHPLSIPTQPWESISMDLLGGLPTTRKGHEYLFVEVDLDSTKCAFSCLVKIPSKEKK
jgi:hypothetical protein